MADDNMDVNNTGADAGSESSTDATATQEATTGNAGDGGDNGTDKTVPYSRFKEVNDQLVSLKAEQASKLPTTPTEGKPGATSTTDGKAVDTKQFVTKADLDERERINGRVTEAKALTEKLNGQNGWPAFDIDKVNKFMKETPGMVYVSYETAYRTMNHDAIVEAEKTKAVEEALKGNTGQTTTKGKKTFGDRANKDALTPEGVGNMSLEDYHKMGGSNALKDSLVSGNFK